MVRRLDEHLVRMDEAISVLMRLRVALEVIEHEESAPEHHEDARERMDRLTVYAPPAMEAT